MSENVLNRGVLRNVAPVLQLSFTMRLQKIGLNPTLLTGLVLLALVVLVAIAAPLLTPYDPIEQRPFTHTSPVDRGMSTTRRPPG